MLRRRSANSFAQRTLCAAVAASFGTVVCAQPTGMTPIHGAASVSQHGARTTVTTTNGAGTNHSAIDWRSFGVPGGQTLFFSQPNAASTSINRVLGGQASGIDGTLGSNGRLVLVNPAGIAFGAGAVVDTAGFTASTLSMSAADAIAGRMRFGTGDTTTAAGKLQVDGQVLARNGDVVLIGPNVETGSGALVQASGGDVVIAAGRKVELTGRGLEGIRLEVRAPEDQAVNLGTLRGDSVGIFASRLRHSGLVQATGVTVSGGKVILQGGAQAEVAGSIQASTAHGGGSVHVTAERLVLKASTSIDVSHLRGGGEILVGGGWQGRDARVVNAKFVDLEPGVQLKADATLSGNGGTVVVWSDDITRFRGAISARGAGAVGAGGNAEVSGRRQLIFRGKVDLGAASGRVGNLLLDPEDVTIQGGTGDGSDVLDLSTTQAADLLGAGGLLAGTLPLAYTIYESELEGMDANISIQASRSIVANGSFGGSELTIAPDRNFRLELTAGGSGGIDLTGMPVRTQGTGRVEMVTAGSGQPIRPDRITTAGGTITLAAAASALDLRSPLDSSGAPISLSGTRVDFSGTHAFSSGTAVTVSAPAVTNAGTLALASGATLSTDAGVFNNDIGATIEGSGTIQLTAGKLINEGTLRPGGAGTVGELRIDGELEMGDEARLEIDVAGAASHDRLTVTGRFTADAVLALSAGSYVPSASDSFTVVKAGSLSGSFETLDAPAFGAFAVSYPGPDVRVAAAAPAPAPAPAPATDSGGKGDDDDDDDDKGGKDDGKAKAPSDDKGAGGDGKDKDTSKPKEDDRTARDDGKDKAPKDDARDKARNGPNVARTGGERFADGGPAPQLVPASEQPLQVLAAMQEPVSATETFLAQAARLEPLSSDPEDPLRKRRVVLTAEQCRVE